MLIWDLFFSFFREINEDFDLNSFKIVLFALSNAKLPEKYRCMYRKFIFIPLKSMISKVFSGK
jgi:hypothetical protein